MGDMGFDCGPCFYAGQGQLGWDKIELAFARPLSYLSHQVIKVVWNPAQAYYYSKKYLFFSRVLHLEI